MLAANSVRTMLAIGAMVLKPSTTPFKVHSTQQSGSVLFSYAIQPPSLANTVHELAKLPVLLALIMTVIFAVSVKLVMVDNTPLSTMLELTKLTARLALVMP